MLPRPAATSTGISMTAAQVFTTYSVSKLQQLGERIAACLDQLTAEQVWTRNSDNENAAGNLVLHLCGNMRQWIGYGVAGQTDIRHRDSEFAARGELTPADLKQCLLDGVHTASAIISGLSEQRLMQTITVQGYDLTVLEAVYHVVEHFSQHTGQIIFITKWCTGADTGFYRHIAGPGHSWQVP